MERVHVNIFICSDKLRYNDNDDSCVYKRQEEKKYELLTNFKYTSIVIIVIVIVKHNKLAQKTESIKDNRNNIKQNVSTRFTNQLHKFSICIFDECL